jgi:hypothetical protein
MFLSPESMMALVMFDVAARCLNSSDVLPGSTARSELPSCFSMSLLICTTMSYISSTCNGTTQMHDMT